MKVVIPVFLIYYFFGFIFHFLFSNDLIIAVIFSVTYMFFSKTYFIRTFIPYVLTWFGGIMNDDDSMKKMRDNDSMKPYIGFIGQFYISVQNNDSSKLNRAVKKVSYLSFLILPILFYVHYILYVQIKQMKK